VEKFKVVHPAEQKLLFYSW